MHPACTHELTLTHTHEIWCSSACCGRGGASSNIRSNHYEIGMCDILSLTSGSWCLESVVEKCHCGNSEDELQGHTKSPSKTRSGWMKWQWWPACILVTPAPHPRYGKLSRKFVVRPKSLLLTLLLSEELTFVSACSTVVNVACLKKIYRKHVAKLQISKIWSLCWEVCACQNACFYVQPPGGVQNLHRNFFTKWWGILFSFFCGTYGD